MFRYLVDAGLNTELIRTIEIRTICVVAEVDWNAALQTVYAVFGLGDSPRNRVKGTG